MGAFTKADCASDSTCGNLADLSDQTTSYCVNMANRRSLTSTCSKTLYIGFYENGDCTGRESVQIDYSPGGCFDILLPFYGRSAYFYCSD